MVTVAMNVFLLRCADVDVLMVEHVVLT
jgi:hypothetical protein